MAPTEDQIRHFSFISVHYSWALLSRTQSGLAQSVKIRHLVVEGFCVMVKQEALVSSQRVMVMLSPPYAIKAKC